MVPGAKYSHAVISIFGCPEIIEALDDPNIRARHEVATPAKSSTQLSVNASIVFGKIKPFGDDSS